VRPGYGTASRASWPGSPRRISGNGWTPDCTSAMRCGVGQHAAVGSPACRTLYKTWLLGLSARRRTPNAAVGHMMVGGDVRVAAERPGARRSTRLVQPPPGAVDLPDVATPHPYGRPRRPPGYACADVSTITALGAPAEYGHDPRRRLVRRLSLDRPATVDPPARTPRWRSPRRVHSVGGSWKFRHTGSPGSRRRGSGFAHGEHWAGEVPGRSGQASGAVQPAAGSSPRSEAFCVAPHQSGGFSFVGDGVGAGTVVIRRKSTSVPWRCYRWETIVCTSVGTDRSASTRRSWHLPPRASGDAKWGVTRTPSSRGREVLSSTKIVRVGLADTETWRAGSLARTSPSRYTPKGREGPAWTGAARCRHDGTGRLWIGNRCGRHAP